MHAATLGLHVQKKHLWPAEQDRATLQVTRQAFQRWIRYVARSRPRPEQSISQLYERSFYVKAYCIIHAGCEVLGRLFR